MVCFVFFARCSVAYLDRCVGAMKVIPGQGMPSHRHHEPGSLFVKLNIKFPDFIDPTLIPHLEAALPPRDPPVKYGKEIMVEEVEMSDLDARQQEAAQKSADAMDEDDDEQPRVQCKSWLPVVLDLTYKFVCRRHMPSGLPDGI